MNYRRLSAVCICTAVLTLAWVAATPSTAIPVGLTVTTGGSMGPDRAGELVVYVDTEPTVDDEVIFYSNKLDKYVRHRVVDETPHGFETQGDALSMTDVEYRGEYVTDENYVGKAVVSI